MLETNDIYLVRRKADNTFEELGESPFQYTGDPGDSSASGNEFSIKTKLRVPELLVEGTHSILHTDTQTSEQLLITNDGTGPAVVINQKGQEAILDIQDDDASVLYIRGDNPYGGNVGIGMGRGPIFSSSNFTEGKTYTIASVNDGIGGADTDFTVFGSPSNTIGEVFTVTAGAQGGTGTANLTMLPAEQLELTKNMLLASDTSIFFRNASDTYGVAYGASISYTDDERLVISNPEGEGVELTATTDANVQMKIGTAGGVTLGKVNPEYENSGSHVEVSGDAKVNLMLTHRNESISGKLDINGTTNTLDIGTTTAHDLTLGTRNVAFFTLDQYGHAFLKQANPGSGLTGGDLTIDGKLSLGGDMLSIAGEEVLYSDYIHVTGTPKEYKILEFTYPTEIDDDNEATGDEGSAFIIEVWSDYQNAGEYVKYSLCHTFLDTANDGSTTGGDLDDPGSRDYALKILESHSVPNAGSFRIRLPKAGDGDIGDSDKNTSTSFDIAALPVFLDLKNYAGVRVKITSLSSGTKRIATDVNWSDSDEYRFWSAPTGVTIADWNANTPNTEPGDALFADTFYGSRNVNWLGTESGYSPYYLKPADTGTSMVVAGNVGIGTDSPNAQVHINADVDGVNTVAGLLIDAKEGSIESATLDISVRRTTDGGQFASLNVYDSEQVSGVPKPLVLQSNGGKVGIGTDSPDRNLTVAGNFRLEKTAADGGHVALDFNSGGSADHPELNIYDKDGTEGVFTIKDGDVGIGTASPTSRLEVEGTTGRPVASTDAVSQAGTATHVNHPSALGADLSVNSQITIQEELDNIGQGRGTGVGFLCKYINSGVVSEYLSGAIDTWKESTVSSNYGSAMRFFTHKDGVPHAVERMRINSDGNVGIGTDTAGAKLEVSSNSGNSIRLRTDSANNTVLGSAFDIVQSSTATNNLTYASNLDFQNRDSSGDFQSRLYIKHDGNVGIGTDSPSARLSIEDDTTGWVGINLQGSLKPDNSNHYLENDWTIYNSRGMDLADPHFLGFYNHDTNNGATAGYKFLVTKYGNVGIGTAAPKSNLDTVGTIRALSGTHQAPSGGKGIEVFHNGTKGHVFAYDRDASSYGDIQLGSSFNVNGSTDDCYINHGKLGIGTASPLFNLDLGSDTSGEQLIRLRRGAGDTNQWCELGYRGITTRSGNTLANNQTPFFIDQKGADGTRRAVTVSATGNVGIGAESPASLLDVDGDVNARGYLDENATANDFELCYSSPTKKEYSKVITFNQPGGGTYGFNLAFEGALNNLLGLHYKLTITSGRYDAGDGSRTVNQGTITDEAYLYFEDDGDYDNNGTKTFREPLMEASIGGLHLVSVADYGASSDGNFGMSAPYNYAVVRYNIDLPASAIKINNGAPRGKFSLHLEVFDGVDPLAKYQAPTFLSTNTP
jgi:hypothetical protein